VVRMRITALVLGLLFAAGCSTDANKKLDAIADRACKCTDFECAMKINEDLEAWSKAAEGKADVETAQKTFAKIMSCVTKAQLGAKAGKAMDRMMDGAGEVMDKAGKAVDKAVDKAGEAVDKAGGAVDKAGEAAEKADQAVDK
jgi:hypothetical protein